METLQIGPWVIKYDADSTRKVYEQIPDGDAERCGCEFCMNFSLARNQVYPKDVIQVLTKLGVDFKKEEEVYHFRRVEPGWHHYGGNFHFVGTIGTVSPKKNSDAQSSQEDFIAVNQNFSWFFNTKRDLAIDAFGDQPLVQIIFNVRVPWLLETEEPT
jgi:hypothetical protein